MSFHRASANMKHVALKCRTATLRIKRKRVESPNLIVIFGACFFSAQQGRTGGGAAKAAANFLAYQGLQKNSEKERTAVYSSYVQPWKTRENMRKHCGFLFELCPAFENTRKHCGFVFELCPAFEKQENNVIIIYFCFTACTKHKQSNIG